MKSRLFLLAVILISFTACTTVTLTPANFGWPIEYVAATDEEGNVVIDRYSTEFNAANLFKAEFGDSVSFAGRELRIIRDHLGSYVMTAKNFINVYVFEVSDGKLSQVNKIFVTKEGLQNPALNQRAPNIEVLDGDKKYTINSKGTVR